MQGTAGRGGSAGEPVRGGDAPPVGPLDRVEGAGFGASYGRPTVGWSSTTCWCWPDRLLRTNAEVRAALQHRFQVLLLDEFQDTDPIQIELAVRIAGGRDGDRTSLAGRRDPGRVTVRGRRSETVDLPVPAGRHRATSWTSGIELDATERLTTNFRTVAPVLGWINEVFGR